MTNEYDDLEYAIAYMARDGQEKRQDVTLRTLAENIENIREHGGVIVGITYIPYKQTDGGEKAHEPSKD